MAVRPFRTTGAREDAEAPPAFGHAHVPESLLSRLNGSLLRPRQLGWAMDSRAAAVCSVEECFYIL
jgi:hypothetical protein